ncbi:MAG: glycosyltransferase family 4 protein [Gemmatimonadales bacterium]
MKIIAVNWLDRANPKAGGAEIHFHEIFGRMVARGHEVTMVTSGWGSGKLRETVDGIDVHRFGGRHTFALKGRGALRRLLKEQSFDIVVEDINKLPLFLSNLTNLPFYVIVPHLFGSTAFQAESLPIASIVWLAERPIPMMYRRAAFHAISDSTKDDLVSRGVAPESIRVIYPGVDSKHYSPDPSMPRRPEPSFLYIGRLKRYKGVDIAVRAVAAARSRGHRLTLDVAGVGDDMQRLRKLVAALGMGDQVHFLGFVSEAKKIELLRETWAALLPSSKEGWGISNIEAAACGTPAVASDSPGLRESVRHDQTGILVPHGDVEAMATALIRLSEHPEVVESFGVAARRFAEELSWEESAKRTEAHLIETIG